ncbi:MAG: type II toxin-antitoxin system MqsR family toxin [Candidatus Omnitrophica bacterium]|nr:type II toxin-antitoxin system MqsR family toxin [Candidatus Omnitrophota bacterium]
MAQASQSDITLFFIDFKRVAQDKFIFVGRKVNLDCISRLGITIKGAKNIIFGLTYRDYISGPDKDRDRKMGNVWVFGTLVDKTEVYLKLSDNFKCNIAKCISFHEANYRCTYPYKAN